MTERWKLFELNAEIILNEKIKIENIIFKNCGGSDSTQSDIKILYDKKELFRVEAKLTNSQSGQFVVLLNDSNKFEFSLKNKEPLNQYSEMIITYMNNNLDKFLKYGTKSLNIELNKDIFSNWIISHYKNKNAKFFIISDISANFSKSFIKVFPLEKISDEFDITANYRIKRSGSAHMPKSSYDEVKKILETKFMNSFTLSDEGFVSFNGLKPKKQNLSEIYHLAVKGNNKYQVTKRGSTKNANIIFSLKFKGEKKTEGFDELKATIKKLI